MNTNAQHRKQLRQVIQYTETLLRGDAVNAERWRGRSEQGAGLCKPEIHVDQDGSYGNASLILLRTTHLYIEREKGDWIDNLIIKESNKVYGQDEEGNE